MEIKIGSFWSGNDRSMFKVTGLIETPEGLWVHYTQTSTGRTFNCLSEAFTHRFNQVVS